MRKIKKLLLGRLRHKYETIIRNHKIKFRLAAMRVVANSVKEHEEYKNG